MTRDQIRLGLFFTALATTLLAAIAYWTQPNPRIPTYPHAWPAQPPRPSQLESYPWQAAKENLEKVGRAIAMYREICGSMPRNQRKDYLDAGLPYDMRTLLDQSKPWALSADVLFGLVGPTHVPRQKRTLLTTYAYVAIGCDVESGISNAALIWQKRGDDMPILLDTNMYSPIQWRQITSPTKVLVLRLGGEVETIDVNPKNRRELFESK